MWPRRRFIRLVIAEIELEVVQVEVVIALRIGCSNVAESTTVAEVQAAEVELGVVVGAVWFEGPRGRGGEPRLPLQPGRHARADALKALRGLRVIGLQLKQIGEDLHRLLARTAILDDGRQPQKRVYDVVAASERGSGILALDEDRLVVWIDCEALVGALERVFGQAVFEQQIDVRGVPANKLFGREGLSRLRDGTQSLHPLCACDALRRHEAAAEWPLSGRGAPRACRREGLSVCRIEGQDASKSVDSSRSVSRLLLNARQLPVDRDGLRRLAELGEGASEKLEGQRIRRCGSKHRLEPGQGALRIPA